MNTHKEVSMKRYRDWSPTPLDTKGLNAEDRQDWFVGLGRNRDSDCLEESNFQAALNSLGGEGESVEVHRFGHWACGWLEVMLVSPDKADELREIFGALDDYPVLDEDDYTDRRTRAAAEMWQDNYNEKERIAFIKAHAGSFEFRDFADLMGCVRGRYFGGDDNELL